MAKYDHSMLVLASLLAGVILMLLGVAALGRIVAKVPHSIVVGFTIGIAFTIALSQVGEILGHQGANADSLLREDRSDLRESRARSTRTPSCIGLATFLIAKYILKVSVFIPAPLIALGIASLVAAHGVGG